MRLFIGIDLPEHMRDGAAAGADAVRQALSRVAPRTVLRWVNPSNLHITLWFLGEVDERRAEAIAAGLALPFGTTSFELHVGGAGVFPPSGPPRALWFDVRQGSASLIAVHA